MESLEAYWEREGAKVEKALGLARDIQEALDAWREPFYDGVWEHLGDAERDVRVLLEGLFAAEDLMAGMVPIEMA